MSILGERLARLAAREGDRIALAGEAGTAEPVRSRAELHRETGELAGRYAAPMDQPGGVLLAEVDNDFASVVTLVAALSTDLPLAVMSRRAPEAEVVAVQDALLARGHDVGTIEGRDLRVRRSDRRARSSLPAESVLLATGGSSGRPKIVVNPLLRTIGARHRRIRPSSSMHWRPGQRQLVVGPLHHVAALSYFVEGLTDGNAMVVQRVFDPARSLRLIEDWAIEWLQLTPYHLRLLAASHRTARTDLSSIRGLLHLAAPCPARTKRFWLDAVGADRVFEMYGATEPIGVTLARGDEWLERPGTVGRGFFTRIRVLDDAGRRLPPGEPGDVYMRSGTADSSVYLDAAQRLDHGADGFVSVNDRGRLDADGYLYLEPRQVGRIQVGGETVYPDEVESVLAEHPEVLDAAVTGVPDERIGEVLVALVVPASAAYGERSLRAYARRHLSRHKVPRHVRFVDRLPRGGSGKLDRRALAEIAGSASGGPRREGRR